MIDPFAPKPLRCTHPSQLPSNHRVDDDLILEGADFATLPINLRVNGSLFLIGTRITELSDDLFVAENIGLSNNPITAFPILVDANLILSDGTSVLPNQWGKFLTRGLSLFRNSARPEKLPQSFALLGSRSSASPS